MSSRILNLTAKQSLYGAFICLVIAGLLFLSYILTDRILSDTTIEEIDIDTD